MRHLERKSVNTVVAVGNFDGVHIGHVRVIKTAAEYASEHSCRTVAMTFTPHPRVFFGKISGPFRITSDEEKKSLLLSAGADEVIFHPFDADFAAKTATQFLEELKTCYNCKAVVCGENFRFGSEGRYDVKILREVATHFGIDVIAVKMEESSSTKIRLALGKGDVRSAGQMLGRPFSVCGKVVHGKHIGTSIGFPTVNTQPSEQSALLAFGVYATKVECGGRLYTGLTNVGVRPTVDFSVYPEVSVETFLLDTKEDLYGENARIMFLERIRDERRFDSTAALAAQISADCDFVRQKYPEK